MLLAHAGCVLTKQHVNTARCVTLGLANTFFLQKKANRASPLGVPYSFDPLGGSAEAKTKKPSFLTASLFAAFK